MTENKEFKNRVFGAAIVKAINSNYNADFSGQPRTLPNGQVYATDKAFKYTVKNYLKDVYHDQYIFFFKRLDENLNPYTLEQAFKAKLGKDKELDAKKKESKQLALNELLRCLDIRFFGATFAMKAAGGNIAVSIHGPVQVNHGTNIWHENNIYSEQILSPFRNPKEQTDETKETSQTTLGRQSKLHEGHYLHHFSVNPKNLEDHQDENTEKLSQGDIDKLKEAMQRGATYYDSTSKSGTENELLVWIQLKETSKVVLPNFSQLIRLEEEKTDGKVVADLAELNSVIDKHQDEIESVEIYRNASSVQIQNEPKKADIKDI
ncbi:MAG: type I CRISPR-associated protein Cas7 [Bacteroidales bacterium]|nr:type I CRISPR-associated protein Cas7 [Bacteroidales bacterium]MCF8328338.1 type I CRISPR-associated protein Cas7 [Bacteroidales bacterium]